MPGGNSFSLHPKLLIQGITACAIGEVRLIKRHFLCPFFKAGLWQKFQANQLRCEKLARVIVDDLHGRVGQGFSTPGVQQDAAV